MAQSGLGTNVFVGVLFNEHTTAGFDKSVVVRTLSIFHSPLRTLGVAEIGFNNLRNDKGFQLGNSKLPAR